MNERDAEFIERLAQTFAEKLQQARSVSDKEHFDHHQWIAGKIERDKMIKDFFLELLKHVTKWGTIGVVSVFFVAFFLGVKIALNMWLSSKGVP